MDSRFLQTFVSVVELGSIAEAARHLDITAATIAQRMHSLEESVGAKLIVRAGRTVRPTVAGMRILDRARAMVRDMRDLKSAASDTDLPVGPLRLGAIPSALMGILPLVLKAWVKSHPHIEIFMEPAATTVLYGRVLSGDLDAAVMVHPMFSLPKTCAWHELRREPLILLTPHDMHVDDALAAIAREPFIRYDRQTVAGKLADDYLRARGVRPQVRIELDGIEYIAKMVAEGLGVSVLPDWALIGAANPALKKWPLPAPCPSRTVGVVWQRATVRAPLVEAFVDLARPLFQVT